LMLEVRGWITSAFN